MRSFKNIAMFAIVILLFVIVLGDKEWALPLAQILGKGIIGFFAANVGQKGIDAYREARENGKD